jgi:hypothetical protein
VWALFPKHQPQDRLHWQNRLFENQRIFTGIAAILLLKFSFDAALLAGDALLSRPNFVRWSAAVILLALGFMPRRPRTHWAAIFVLAGLFSYFVVLEHL